MVEEEDDGEGMDAEKFSKSGVPHRTWYRKHVQKDPFLVYYSYVQKSRS